MNKKNNKGLVILSQYFYPEVASTGQLLTELAEDLVKYGCKIKVYTGKPSYYGNIKEYKKREIYHGIEIYRLFNTTLNKNSKLGKILNSLSYFISIVFKLLSSKDRYPLLIVSNPPFLPIAGFSNDLSGRSLLKLCDEVLLKIPLSNKLGLPYGVIGGYQQIHEYLKRDMRTIKSELTRQREE